MTLLGVVTLVLLVAVIVLVRRTSRLSARLDGITRGESGKSFEDVLEAHIDKV